jgi:hypothetical protein
LVGKTGIDKGDGVEIGNGVRARVVASERVRDLSNVVFLISDLVGNVANGVDNDATGVGRVECRDGRGEERSGCPSDESVVR